MPKEKMISGNWWGEVKKAASPKYIEWEANPIEVTVDFPKELHEKLKKDPLLLQKLSDGGSEKYKAFIASAAKKVKSTESDLEKLSKEFEKDKDIVAFGKKWDAIQEKFVREMRTEVESAEKEIDKGIMDAFAKYQKTKKEYKGYKIRSGIKLGLKFAALGFAIAKLVGTSGADLMAWRSLVRDSIKTVSEIGKLCVSAETFRKATEKQLKVVLAWQAKLGDGKGVTTAEVGLGLLKAVIGTDCEMSIDAVGANVKQFRNKLKGVELSAHKAAKELQLALNRMDSVKAEVPADIKSEMATLETDVRDLITKVSDLMGDVNKGIDWANTVEKIVTDIKKAKSITHLSKMVKALESAADIASSASGWADFADKGDKLGTRIVKQTITVGKNIDRWQDDVKKTLKAA
ncbi:hypothetical protein LNKW23_03520 [Paralimibaculum aggregatum]|uniref:Uncharacterized protein n=1 Tax=Paralimibaculum aggregatum TaxID=3036245 RepID=A0ABQ6LG06_9RHOB|nr:hypothetical protein [Limibaculum sp. NKW23]GMG81140.1 hypothetical protein LNKW23_03520 [Limibaculum sp. NKW23]